MKKPLNESEQLKAILSKVYHLADTGATLKDVMVELEKQLPNIVAGK